MKKQLLIPDAQAMEVFGGRLAQAVEPATLVFLEGELGAGKTTLVRGFLRELGHAGAVKSPTYTLVEPYELPGGDAYHFDLYRLADPEELEFIGIRDYLASRAVLLVEWPSQGVGLLPEPDLRIGIAYHPAGREVTLEAGSERGGAALRRLEV